MHIFGFSKKTKKRLSSGPLNLGLRRSKSTGNITCHNPTTAERDDSSTDSSSSGNNSSNDMKKQQPPEKCLNTGRNVKCPVQTHLVFEAPAAAPQTKATEDTKPSPPLPGLTTAMDRLSIKGINGVSSAHSDNNLSSKTVPAEPTQPTKQHQSETNNGAWTSSGNSGINPDDLDTLLSMETEQRVNAQAERRAVESAPTTPLRPTRLKFELPVTPSRSRSPSNQKPITYPRARPYRSHSEESRLSVDRRKPADANAGGRGGKQQGERKRRHRRWSKLIGSDTEDDEDDDGGDEKKSAGTAKRSLELGAYVNLIKRPLPTMGYVRYIGPVEGEPGNWIGVELEHRVGNCDGSIKGQRFFKTDPQRGIFTKRFDLEVVVV